MLTKNIAIAIFLGDVVGSINMLINELEDLRYLEGKGVPRVKAEVAVSAKYAAINRPGSFRRDIPNWKNAFEQAGYSKDATSVMMNTLMDIASFK